MIDQPFGQQTFSDTRVAVQPDYRGLVRLQRKLAAATLPPGEALADDTYLRRLALWPLYLLLFHVALGIVCAFIPGAFYLVIASEQGFVENITVIYALIGAWVAYRVMREAPPSAGNWLKIWFGFFAFGLLFIAGEETSWGQQWFMWSTPDWIALHNTQGETNLHNYSKLTENLPKVLLTIGVYMAGLLCPLLVLLRGPMTLVRSSPLNLIWPSPALWMSAVLALALRLAERIAAWTGGFHKDADLFRGLREGLEIFLVLFLMLYVIDVLARYRRLAGKQ